MTTHELKTWPEYFHAVWQRKKTFEVRKNDRDYKVGDYLILRAWDPIESEYTGSWIELRITYILDDSRFVKEGFVVLGFNFDSTEPPSVAAAE